MATLALPSLTLPTLNVSALGKINPHTAVGAALGVSALVILLSAVFGDPELAESVSVQPIATIEVLGEDASASGHSATEHAAAGSHDVILDLRPGSDRATEPSLPGVHDPSVDGWAGVGGDEDASSSATARRADALPAAPLAGFAQPGPGGYLPAIAPDGRTPAQAYARPFANDAGRPRIALVIGGLGLSRAVTQAAIDELPGEVTLSFVPYADELQTWVNAARTAGHEVILEVPMEPFDYPANDPGPHTLLAETDASENARRLDWVMARTTGYFAIMNYLGARFTASDEALEPFLNTLRDRGVALLYDGESARSSLRAAAARLGTPYAAADRVVDARPSPESIDEQLLHLEAMAIQNGASLGVGSAYPVTIAQIGAWADTLDFKGYVLAPVSAVLAERAASAALDDAETADHAGAPRTHFQSVAAGYNRRGGEEEGDTGGSGH